MIYNNYSSLSSKSSQNLSISEKYNILRSEYEFLPEQSDNNEDNFMEEYYSKLYREFCLVDLSRYKKGKLGLSWCTEDHILKGKGYKICANISCDKTKHLKAYEVNMKYTEKNEIKNALVKVYLCHKCGNKLNKVYIYRKNKTHSNQE